MRIKFNNSPLPKIPTRCIPTKECQHYNPIKKYSSYSSILQKDSTRSDMLSY